MAVIEICPSRIGFMGNPSDGFHGKTLSFLLHNFYAKVVLEEHHNILICPNPALDPGEYSNLSNLLLSTSIGVGSSV